MKADSQILDLKKLLDRFSTPDELEKTVELAAAVDKGLLSENFYGYNAWHAAVLYYEFALEKIEILSKYDIDINSRDSRPGPGLFSNTPLHVAIANENSKVAYALLDFMGKKIDFSVTDKEKKTTLIFAAKINSDGIAIKILDAIPPKKLVSIIDMQDKDDMTALHYACLYGNQRLVDELLKRGVNKDMKNNKGRIPFECTMMPIADVKAALSSVEIDFERDEKAKKNEIFDKNRMCMVILNKDEASKVEEMNEAVHPMKGIKSRKSFQRSIERDIPQFNIVCSSSYYAYGRGRVSSIRCLSEDEKKIFLEQFDSFSGVRLLDDLKIKRRQLRDYFIKEDMTTDWMLRKMSGEGNAGGFFDQTGNPSMSDDSGKLCQLCILF